MLTVLRLLTRLAERLLLVPVVLARMLTFGVGLTPRLGPLRYAVYAAVGYLAFALTLVYVVAPIRGVWGGHFLSAKLRYDAERWLATAIYDARGNFVGTFDPRLDSRRDVNYTESAIAIGDYVANPDHKSIPVREVPEHYWRCLAYQEDRHIGTALNPYGIDLFGVLKIPYSTLKRSIALGQPSLGVGGSTLPMQFARVIYKTPPHAGEGGLTKLRRKLKEWWLAPVIYHELTRAGDDTALRQWAANHIWLAQRTGGQPLHGVEVTSRIVFGKEAKDLSIAEQYVLASAVNKPIILLEGSDKLNEVRLDRWRYITEVRARTCAERLVADAQQQRKVVFELVQLAGGPPDPRVKPKLQEALEHYAPSLAKRAQANPIIRANALIPFARLGIREEMKQAFGFDWRNYVRGVTTTLDVVENLAFRERIRAELVRLEAAWGSRLSAGFTLDPGRPVADRKSPNVVVVAANAQGEIVRYYDHSENTPYFGSAAARDGSTGRYVRAREPRAIASTGKIIAAIGIANEHRDGTDTLYADSEAPDKGLETCVKGSRQGVGRKAIVAFACSLNRPVEWRAAQLGQDRVRRLIDALGFNMPAAATAEQATPPSTAAVRGLVTGSPQRVHHMSAVVLAALLEQGGRPVRQPSLVKAFDFTSRENAVAFARDRSTDIVPSTLIRRDGHGLLRALLQAPLCYSHAGVQHGTLKGLSNWCAERRADLRFHFAKTGTHTTADLNQTVDTLITGGLQFANGAAYSYVVLVGTGSTAEPWARNLHAAQVGVPLATILLDELQGHAMRNPAPGLLPPRPVADSQPAAQKGAPGRPQVDAAELFRHQAQRSN
jgi:membrane peptidoglycan carboxypeptidase